MRLTTQQIVVLSEMYLDALEGSDALSALLLHAEKAGVNLKYIQRLGLDASVIGNIFKAANAQGKLDVLLEVIQKDGLQLHIPGREATKSHLDTMTSENSTLRIKITNHAHYMPTSMVLSHSKFTLLDGYIHNPSSTPKRVIIRVAIWGSSDIVTTSIEVHPPMTPIPTIRPPQFTKEEGSRFTHTIISSRLTVELFLPGISFPVDTWETDIWLTQPDIVLLYRRNREGNFEDYTSNLAWWVNSGAPGLANLLAQILNLDIRQRLGYPKRLQKTKREPSQEEVEFVDTQVRALYEEFQQKPFTYMPTELIQSSNDDHILQRIRMPEDILMDPLRRANCLDAAVLIACLLEYMGLEPLLLILPQHALVGWKRIPISLSEIPQQNWFRYCCFLDIILASAGMSYEVAVSSGEGYFLKALKILGKQSGNFDEFASLVDVKSARGVNFN